MASDPKMTPRGTWPLHNVPMQPKYHAMLNYCVRGAQEHILNVDSCHVTDLAELAVDIVER